MPMAHASQGERGPRVDPYYKCGRLGDSIPARDLHPKPVVEQRVPEVLLALDEGPVLLIQAPLAGPVGDPARDSGLPGAPRPRVTYLHLVSVAPVAIAARRGLSESASS